MHRGAIFIFAFSLTLFGCQTNTFYPPPSERPTLSVPSAAVEAPIVPTVLINPDIPSLKIVGRHEIHPRLDMAPTAQERSRDGRTLTKNVESLPIGPDIVVKELDLTEDFDLSIALSNAGEGELRKGAILRIRIFLNDRPVSEFNHFVTEPLKANFGNHYIIDPPYRVRIEGNSKVRVVVVPKQAVDDIRPGNNAAERDFFIFAFRIGPQASQDFPILLRPRRSKDPRPGDRRRGEKVKTEVRWDGGGAPVRLSVKRGGKSEKISPISGKSPLKLEIPIAEGRDAKGKSWRISVANLMEQRAEGHLIIQSP